MDITIKETGEIKSLTIIDPRSGNDWINDLMGHYNALPEDGVMTNDDYEWWSGLTAALAEADQRIVKIEEQLLVNDPDAYANFIYDLESLDANDLEHHPRRVNELCDEYEL